MLLTAFDVSYITLYVFIKLMTAFPAAYMLLLSYLCHFDCKGTLPHHMLVQSVLQDLNSHMPDLAAQV